MRVILLAAFLAAPPSAQLIPADAPKDPYLAALAELKNKEPMVRRHGADQLGQLRRSEAAPFLLPLLDDESPFVRATAADTLGLLHAGSSVPKISQLLSKDKDPSVRQGAAIALAYIGDPAAADALIGAISDDAAGVRFAAVRSIGVMRLSKA